MGEYSGLGCIAAKPAVFVHNRRNRILQFLSLSMTRDLDKNSDYHIVKCASCGKGNKVVKENKEWIQSKEKLGGD